MKQSGKTAKPDFAMGDQDARLLLARLDKEKSLRADHVGRRILINASFYLEDRDFYDAQKTRDWWEYED